MCNTDRPEAFAFRPVNQDAVKASNICSVDMGYLVYGSITRSSSNRFLMAR